MYWKQDRYLQELEHQGIDTVCFLGSGWNFEEILISQEFYIPYAYYGYNAQHSFNGYKDSDDELLLNQIKNTYKEFYWHGKDVDLYDRFRLIKKYSYKENQIYKGGRYRIYNCIIENLRTKEKFYIKEDEFSKFRVFILAEPK